MAKTPALYIEKTPAAKLHASRQGLKDFLAMRYGLSIHWGLYALVGKGEWALFTENIPVEKYRMLMAKFNPTRFCADEWADLMLESGQKFLIFTSKHHDGFCLWDTKLTDFKVTNSAFGRDVIAELSAALQARGLGLVYYYSLLDWTHPAYRNDWPAYVAYYQGQLRELLTNYGRITGVIFDGYWPRSTWTSKNAHFLPGDSWKKARGYEPSNKWDLAGTYDLIHTLQPGAVVVNNTHVPPLAGEDMQVWELDMPGENAIGFNTTEVGDRPTAVWWNLNEGWSYCPRAHKVKPAATILASMRRAYSRGASSFFLNVGPRPFGDIHPDDAAELRRIGTYLRHWQARS
jgi:alpha-L-fucosidase